MTGTKLVFDSSAWIEYFRASKAGEKVKRILENENHSVLTPNIAAAEVVSKMKRNGENFTSAIDGMRRLSRPPVESQDYYIEAAIKHAEMRDLLGDVSLADAIILTLAEKNNAKIVTKDHHLKGKNTIFIG